MGVGTSARDSARFCARRRQESGQGGAQRRATPGVKMKTVLSPSDLYASSLSMAAERCQGMVAARGGGVAAEAGEPREDAGVGGEGPSQQDSASEKSAASHGVE